MSGKEEVKSERKIAKVSRKVKVPKVPKEAVEAKEPELSPVEAEVPEVPDEAVVAKVKFFCGVKTRSGSDCKRNVKEKGVPCSLHKNIEPLPEKVETHECGFVISDDKKCQKMTSESLCSVHKIVQKKREIGGEKVVTEKKEYVLCSALTKKGKPCQKKVVSGTCWTHSN